MKSKGHAISPHILAMLLRTAADGVLKSQIDITVPLYILPWLRAMVRLGSVQAAKELEKVSDEKEK